MKIRHYLYNAFLIEKSAIKLAIDPGINLWMGKLNSLIPKSEWSNITHLLATHGDPDHYWYIEKVAQASGAPIVCGEQVVKLVGDERFLLDPRRKGISYSTAVNNRIYPLRVGEAVDVDGVRIEGLKAVHGPLNVDFLFGLIRVKETPGEGERIGLGNIGFKITIEDTVLVNLGDTLFQPVWEELQADVLMIPIGGGKAGNTMDENEALEAVKLISPKLVIPCHYDGSFLWKRNVNPADAGRFQREVEAMGVECRVMGYGDEFVLQHAT